MLHIPLFHAFGEYPSVPPILLFTGLVLSFFQLIDGLYVLFNSISAYKNYEILCAMESVMIEKIQLVGLKPATVSARSAGQPLTY